MDKDIRNLLAEESMSEFGILWSNVDTITIKHKSTTDTIELKLWQMEKVIDGVSRYSAMRTILYSSLFIGFMIAILTIFLMGDLSISKVLMIPIWAITGTGIFYFVLWIWNMWVLDFIHWLKRRKTEE